MANELILQNIIKEIFKECKTMDNVQIGMEFCNFYVKLLTLDPKWGISDHIMRIRLDVQQFIKYVVNRLEHSEHPSMKALMIECYFEQHFIHLEDSIRLHRKEVSDLLSPLKLAILEPDYIINFDDILDQLVTYIALASGLGNPTEIAVKKEVKVVLGSVFTIKELKEFWCELYTVRVEKLAHLVKLVSGIRLYNMDCDRGGEGIPELPMLLSEAIDAVIETIQHTHDQHVENYSSNLTCVIENCYFPSNTKYRTILSERIPEYATKEDLAYCKDLLLLFKIYQNKLCKLISEADKIKKAFVRNRAKYNEIIAFLHQKVIPNMHLRASYIFPIFERLFEEWSELQNKTVVLMGLKLILDDLNAIMSTAKCENILIEKFAPEIASTCTICLVSKKAMAPAMKPGMFVIKKEYLSFWPKMTLKYEYEGHCCWTLVTTEGFLIKGNDENGIVNYKSKLYLFNSEYGLRHFVDDPEYYITHVLDLARRKCELIMYLRLKTELIALRDVDRIVEDERVYVELAGVGTQTSSDIENNKELVYESNIWKLKERALKMAVLMNCKTTSTQTGNSYNIVPNETQTWPLKEKSTQTNAENSSNTPAPLAFFYGLRGRKDDKQVQMNCALDNGFVRGNKNI